MSMSEPETGRRDLSLPPEVESPRAKLVYLYLDVAGEATIDDLSRDLGLKKLTLYGVLRSLEERDAITKRHDRYFCL